MGVSVVVVVVAGLFQAAAGFLGMALGYQRDKSFAGISLGFLVSQTVAVALLSPLIQFLGANL